MLVLEQKYDCIFSNLMTNIANSRFFTTQIYIIYDNTIENAATT